MSTVDPAIVTTGGHGHADDHGHGHGHHHGSFISTYVFSTDHKMIGFQYLFTGMAMAWLHKLAVTQLLQPAGSSQAARKVGVACEGLSGQLHCH